MRLYHGTNQDFDMILLSKCRPNKDFGRGFYLTDIRNQAEAMANRRCEFEGEGIPVVQTYEFDESLLNSGDLRVKVFRNVCRDWAEFILLNRQSKRTKVHDFDIVIGPVADDGVVYQLNLYKQRLISMDALIKGLTFKRINRQYYFGTELAISKLKRI